MPDDILDAAKTLTADPPITNPPLPQPPEPDSPAAMVTPPSIPEPDNAPVSETPPQTDSSVVESLLKTNNPEPVVPAAPSHHRALPKKGPPKGLILGILILLLLALPVAVFFISQKNQQIADVRSRATGTPYPTDCTNYADPVCRPWDYFCHDNDPNTICGSGQQCNAGEPNCNNCNSLGCCKGGYYRCGGGGDCCKIGTGDDDNGDDDDTTNPTPTPTTGTAPICQNIKIYKDGTQVTNLPSLRAGDAVILAVKGNLTPTRAHFRVNGGSWTETTTTNGSGEFTLAYTVPAGVTEFVIEGEIFTNGAWR